MARADTDNNGVSLSVGLSGLGLPYLARRRSYTISSTRSIRSSTSSTRFSTSFTRSSTSFTMSSKGTLQKKPRNFGFVPKRGGGSRPIRNSYFDLVSEDPMLTGSPNQENEQVFRWFKTCFSDENSQLKLKNFFVYQNKIRNSNRGGGSRSFGPNLKFLGFFFEGFPNNIVLFCKPKFMSKSKIHCRSWLAVTQ